MRLFFGRYQTDLEQATVLLANFRDLDREYLERKVAEQNVKDLYWTVSEKARQIISLNRCIDRKKVVKIYELILG